MFWIGVACLVAYVIYGLGENAGRTAEEKESREKAARVAAFVEKQREESNA